MSASTVVPTTVAASAIPRGFIVRGSGDLQQAEAQESRLLNVADEVERDLAYWRNHLSAAQVDEVSERVARHRREAGDWRALADAFRGA